MDVGEAEVNGESLVDAVEAKNPWRGEVGAGVEAFVLPHSAAGDSDARHSAGAAPGVGSVRTANNRLDDVPFPGEVGERLPLPRVGLESFGHERPDGHGGEEAHADHPFPH